MSEERIAKACKSLVYSIPYPENGFRKVDTFSEAERAKLRPMAETIAMLDGNAFFGMGDGEHYWADQYLPEAYALYQANGGDTGWASEASFAKTHISQAPSPNTPTPERETRR